MDKSEQSPLHYAIYNGHKAAQFALLEGGARVVCQGSEPYTACGR
jgi:ankyrin repeat protein